MSAPRERLYPGYRPAGVRKDWDHCSMGVENAGDVLRRQFVPADWGDPVEAVGWFRPTGGYLAVLVADYANGRRVILRANHSRTSTEFHDWGQQ